MVLALLTVHVSNGCTELVLSRSQHYLWCFDTLFVVLRYTITSVTIQAITKRPIQCFKTLKVVFRVVLNVFRNTFFLQCTFDLTKKSLTFRLKNPLKILYIQIISIFNRLSSSNSTFNCSRRDKYGTCQKPLNLFVKYCCILSHLSIYFNDVGDQIIALYSSKGLTYILNIAIRNFGECV